MAICKDLEGKHAGLRNNWCFPLCTLSYFFEALRFPFVALPTPHTYRRAATWNSGACLQYKSWRGLIHIITYSQEADTCPKSWAFELRWKTRDRVRVHTPQEMCSDKFLPSNHSHSSYFLVPWTALVLSIYRLFLQPSGNCRSFWLSR